MSDTPIGDAVEKLKDLPLNELQVGGVLSNDDAGVEGRFQKKVGKGKSVAVEGGWMKRAGYRVAGMFGWTF